MVSDSLRASFRFRFSMVMGTVYKLSADSGAASARVFGPYANQFVGFGKRGSERARNQRCFRLDSLGRRSWSILFAGFLYNHALIYWRPTGAVSDSLTARCGRDGRSLPGEGSPSSTGTWQLRSSPTVSPRTRKAAERFAHEAKTLAAISHPNILTVFAFASEGWSGLCGHRAA